MRRKALLVGVLALWAACAWAGPGACGVIYVNGYTGLDTRDGSTWAMAKKTIGSAIGAAVSGDEIWVAGYVYKERLALSDGVALYGGFRGDETEFAQRPPCPARSGSQCETVIDGRSQGSVVSVPANAGAGTIIDGFTIRNGSSTEGGGVLCQSFARPIIRNNVIKDNLARGGAGGGISCAPGSAPTIANNTITGNLSVGIVDDHGLPAGGNGGGIASIAASPTIMGNTISGNAAVGAAAGGLRSGSGGGIACMDVDGTAQISDNNIYGNRANADGGGIYSEYLAAAVSGNAVRENEAPNGRGGGIASYGGSSPVAANRIRANTAASGGGVFCAGGTVVSNILSGNRATVHGGGVSAGGGASIVNNTIVENDCDATQPGGEAVFCEGNPILGNNIIAFNSGAVNGPCTESNNRYYQNATGTSNHDPKLRAGNVHIQADSDCREAGDDTLVLPEWTDIDGQPRVQGDHVDIGADESDGSNWDRVIFVTADGDDRRDGSSWRNAKRSVQEAIDAAAAMQPETCRNEVWVAAGTYHGTLTLKLGDWPASEIGLYGGFATTDADILDRDWRKNATVLDGDQVDSVIVVASGATNTTTIDGFTITNGKGHGTNYRGGGIYMVEASPTISHNLITKNGVSTGAGGGIYSFCTSTPSTAVISKNEIRENIARAGGGIFSNRGAAAIANNVIVGNVAQGGSGGGASCIYGSTAVANNLIANNSASSPGGGLEVSLGSPGSGVFNNTITGNSAPYGGAIATASSYSGASIANNVICFNSTGLSLWSSVRSHNCIYGNGDTSPLEPTEIAVDPLLGESGHISRLSPCVDAGDDSAVMAGWTDRDGQARIQGAHVDIGADEADGARWPVLSYVSPTGSDDNPGRSWARAKKTVVGACQAVQPGDEVWVRKGSYIKDGIALIEAAYYGGFAGTEVERAERNPAKNPATLDGQGYVVVLVQRAVTEKSVADGFTITNGKYGVDCNEGSPTISGNIITGCTGGVLAGHDTIVRNNRICLNRGSGIYCPTGSTPTITGNRISASFGSGVLCSGSGGVIANNNITGNSSVLDPVGGVTPSNGGGICLKGTITASIYNNTITANTARWGGGVCFQVCDASGATFANNLVAFNTSGVDAVGTCILPPFANNCVFGNVRGDYTGIADPTGADGNIATDPKLASLAFGDGHIQPDSPCRNAGSMAPLLQPALDLDGQPRWADGMIDIGADDSDGTAWNINPVIRVATTGDDANDGSSWVLAKRTIQAAVTAASPTGGEVWVAAGTYLECVAMGAHVYLYGGFVGTETSRPQRNWHANTTTIDAQRAGTVIGSLKGHMVSRVDGFTLKNGTSASGRFGGAAACLTSSTTITNNVITSSGPCSVYCSESASVIANNVFAANTPFSGSVVDCTGNSFAPTIAMNTFVNNYGTAIHAGSYSTSPLTQTISNNIVAFNRSGITRSGGVVLDLRNNDVFGNTTSDYSGVAPGPSDISADPLFVDRASGDYHLSPGSPCIDKGWNQAAGLGLFDFDGEGRICLGTVDIGSDEYWPSELPIGSVKGAADGAVVHGMGTVVTAAFPDFLYVETPDRVSGIRVEKAAHGLAVGAKTDISGTARTNADGERFIEASSVTQIGDGSVSPVAANNSRLGGGPFGLQEGVAGWIITVDTDGTTHRAWEAATGLNNIGLLIRTTGHILPDLTTPGSFTVDDGSGVRVKCIIPEGVAIDPAWSYVGVTGVCSCEKVLADDREELHAVVRIRSAADVTPF